MIFHIKPILTILTSICLITILLLTNLTNTTAQPTRPTDPIYIESSQGLPTIGQWPFNTAVGDIDQDGNLDLIRLRGHDDFNPEDAGFQIWLGDGQGTWTKTAIPNGNFGYGGTALGDLNNDGYLDAAYGCHHYNSHPMVGAWTGDGGTSFTEHSTGLATDGESFGMAECTLADFTNDGYLDLIVGAFSGTSGIRAYTNHNGGESWTSTSIGLPHNDANPMVNHWILAPDLNRDGNLDIVIQERDIDGTTHYIWTGDGTGNWTANDYGLPVEWYHGTDGLDIGDVNNDGWPDITFIHHTGSIAIPVVYTFDGTGWTPASDGLPTSQAYGPLAFGDLNNDGNLDLVGLENTGDYHTSVHAWLGDGTGTWTELPLIATGIIGGPESVTLADIDHNNRLDIILSSESDGDYTPGGLHVFKETTPASSLDIRLRQPNGGEVYQSGAARTITWTSSIPTGTATIDLDYSTTGPQGPWLPIITGILDSNAYQWHIPNAATTQGYIKATIHTSDQETTAISPAAFTILQGPGNPVNPPAITGPSLLLQHYYARYNFTVNDPEAGSSVTIDWNDGSTQTFLLNQNGTITTTHAWDKPGDYTILAQTRTDTGAQSNWTSHPIQILPLDITTDGTPGHFTITVTNNGPTDITNLTTTISHTGMILCRQHKTQTTPILHPGETQTTSILLLGIGPITLSTSIRADDLYEFSWEINGFLLLVFLLGVK
jgi:hypothetical protein